MVRATYVLLGGSNSLDLLLFIYCPKAAVDNVPDLDNKFAQAVASGGRPASTSCGGRPASSRLCSASQSLSIAEEMMQS